MRTGRDKQLYMDEKLAADEQAELDQLRAEPDVKRLAGQRAWIRLRLSPQQYQKLCVGGTDSFRLRRTQIMDVLEIMPYGSKKALLGHKGYIVSSSCWILVPRHLVFASRNPFH